MINIYPFFVGDNHKAYCFCHDFFQEANLLFEFLILQGFMTV